MVLGVEFIIISTFLLMFVVPVVALIDLLQRREETFRDAGQNRIVWTLVILLMPLVGSVLYATIGRPMLGSADASPSVMSVQ